jgi:hypothetical protein
MVLVDCDLVEKPPFEGVMACQVYSEPEGGSYIVKVVLASLYCCMVSYPLAVYIGYTTYPGYTAFPTTLSSFSTTPLTVYSTLCLRVPPTLITTYLTLLLTYPFFS